MGFEGATEEERHAQAHLQGQKRIIRKMLKRRLGAITALVVVGGSFFTILGTAGAFETRTNSADRSISAVPFIVSSLVFGAVLCVVALLHYQWRMTRLQANGTLRRSHRTPRLRKAGDVVEGGVRSFFVEGQLQARSPQPRAGESANDDTVRADYGPMSDVDVLGQKGEASPDGVNRTMDPRRGPIE
jgi:hypothetical protein